MIIRKITQRCSMHSAPPISKRYITRPLRINPSMAGGRSPSFPASPDQVLASNARRLHGRTDEARPREPDAPRGSNDGKSQSEGDAKVSVPIGGHVRQDFRPSLVAVGRLARCGRHGCCFCLTGAGAGSVALIAGPGLLFGRLSEMLLLGPAFTSVE